MKKLFIAVFMVILSVSCLGFASCAQEAKVYTVTFESGGGTGNAPVIDPQEEGSTFVLPENTFTYEGFEFTGWKTGDQMYQPTATFTMPANDVVFTAQWKEETQEPGNELPEFSASSYSYDRLGGGPLELPFVLHGYNLFYIEVDGTRLASSLYHYDAEKNCIVIDESYILGLADGEYTFEAITDAETEQPLTCVVEVYNSLETSFDPQTQKNFRFGTDEKVDFNVDFNGATVTELHQGDLIIDGKYYNLENDVFSVSAEWLKRYYGETEFTVRLSNNDSYDFTIVSNAIFYTDYDVTTIHSDVQSNIGHNPLYQYTDNVSIVEAPENSQMEGKVLQFTPNTVEVTYSCHAIYTLKTSTETMMWYDPGFAPGNYYAVSFDYMTEGTSVGEFAYKTISGKWSDNLLLGPENDGVLHHYSRIVSYEEIGGGMMLWAFFNGGSGKVYVDNMRIVCLSDRPAVVAESDYDMSGDYEADFSPYDYIWELYCGGELVQGISYDAERGKLIIPEEYMTSLEAGTHTFTVVYPFAEQTFDVRVVDSRVAEFTETSAEYKRDVTGDLKMHGNFDESIELVSFKQKQKSYDSGYAGWEFVNTDFNKEYVEEVSLTTGMDGSGYLLLPEEFLNKFFDATEFVVEFSNGKQAEIQITTNALITDNKDESYLYGKFNGGAVMSSPLNSGLNGNSQAVVRADETGNNAFYITSTENAESASAYTVKFHDHVWDWFKVVSKAGNLYRIVFDYKLTGMAEKDVYFVIMHDPSESVEENFFGTGFEVETMPEWEELRWYLNADGQVHTLDTGWFTWSRTLRLTRIALPSFTAAEGKEIMIDNYAIMETKNQMQSLPTYLKHQAGDYAIDLGGYTFESLTVDGVALQATVSEGKLVLDKNALDTLDVGEHSLVLTTNGGIFKAKLTVADDRVARFKETSADYKRGVTGDLKMYGTFDDTITLVSFKQQAKSYDSGFGGWEFIQTDASVDLSSQVTLVTGQDNTGYLLLPEEFLNKFFGTTIFTVEFSNGVTQEISITTNAIMADNKDETYLYGRLNGNLDTGSPLNSGLWSVVSEVRDDGTGDHAFYITATQGSAATAAYTVKISPHTNEWYSAPGKSGYLYRVIFDYQLTNFSERSVYFSILSEVLEDKSLNFFGEGYEIIERDGFHEVAWYLNADGERHTFDSGWFTYSSTLRLVNINLTSFSEDEGKEIMLDNYAIIETQDMWSAQSYIYGKGQGEPLKVTTGGYTVSGAMIDGEVVSVDQDGDFIIIATEVLEGLEEGNHVLVLQTNEGNFRVEIQITGSGTAILQETQKSVVHGGGSVTLAGSFTETLTVTSLTRQGTNFWDTSKTEPTAMDISYVTITKDGLVLSEELIDQAYGTMKYFVILSNGARLTFTLESNVLHFTNYDETYVHEESQGNVKYCQDTSMAEVVEYNGGHAIKYTPANATLSHSVAANNGTGSDNGIFTFSNATNNNHWWWEYAFDADAKYEVFFDYEIFGDKESAYKFQWIGSDAATMNDVPITDQKGTFSIQLTGAEFVGFRICCPVATPDGNSDTYMIIDNFGFAKVVE